MYKLCDYCRLEMTVFKDGVWCLNENCKIIEQVNADLITGDELTKDLSVTDSLGLSIGEYAMSELLR